MYRKTIPLHVLLVATFVLQTVAAVSLTVWLSWINEQRSVAELNQHLQANTLGTIRAQLNHSLEASTLINQINAQDLASQELTLEDPDRLIRQFWQQRHLLTNTPITAIYFGSADGRFSGLGFQGDRTWQISRVSPATEGRFYTYAPDGNGQAAQLLQQGQPYDPRTRPWYRQAIATQQQTWSAVDGDVKERRLKLTLSQPVFAANRQLIGVVGVDFTLTQLSEFLRSLVNQHLSTLVLLDREGQIVATSTQQPPVTVQQGVLQRLTPAALSDPFLKALAPHFAHALQQSKLKHQPLNEAFQVQGKSGFLWIAPLNQKKLDLWVVAVVSESDFLQTILERSHETLMLCFGVLIPAVLLGLLTAFKLSQGLQQLICGGQAIADGQLNQPCPNSRITELNQASQTFNRMAHQLRQFFADLETQVKTRGAALQESEAKFANVFYHAPNPAAISRFSDETFLEVNDSALNLLGFTRAEFLGQTNAELEISLDPDQHQSMLQRLQNDGFVRGIEGRLKTKSGEIKTVLYSASLIEVEGEPQIISLVHDITDRTQTSEALKRSEEKFAKVFHSNPNPISISRMVDGYFLEVNTSAIAFLKADWDEVIGKTSQDIQLWVDPQERQQFVETLQKNQVVQGQECRLRIATGEIRTVLYSAEIIEIDGQPCLISTINDISDRRQAEEALEQAKLEAESANRAKSLFLSNMSHELRTPLNAILGFAQILNRDSTLAPTQREQLDIINRSGEHLLDMINDVLGMAKIESGRIEVTLTSFNFDHCLKTIENMFSIKASSKGISLIIDKAQTVPEFIKTDEGKLRQILINLLGNAVKFTETGCVRLRVRFADRHLADQPDVLQFEVEDTGPGIAPSELDSIFEAFVQSKLERSPQAGTGLGLPISREFVQILGGKISVQSTPGQGSLFNFYLPTEPASKADCLPQLHQRRVIGLAPEQPQYRLLIVDDRWESRQLMTSLLQPLGFAVREAENGQEAVNVWEDWDPHLIWMDMRMPVMDGYEATQRIKAHLNGQATVIIALTASALDEEKEFILSIGCDDFVRKPFREATIFAVLEQHLGIQFEFDEISPTALNLDELNSTQEPQGLTPQHFQAVPLEWIEQLHWAAQDVNNSKLLQLINQLPETQCALAGILSQLVRNFRCDMIFEVTEQLL